VSQHLLPSSKLSSREKGVGLGGEKWINDREEREGKAYMIESWIGEGMALVGVFKSGIGPSRVTDVYRL